MINAGMGEVERKEHTYTKVTHRGESKAGEYGVYA